MFLNDPLQANGGTTEAEEEQEVEEVDCIGDAGLGSRLSEEAGSSSHESAEHSSVRLQQDDQPSSSAQPQEVSACMAVSVHSPRAVSWHCQVAFLYLI